MKELLYVILIKILYLYLTPIVSCDNNNRILECNQNNIKISNDTSNNAKFKLQCISMSSSCFNNKKRSKNNEIVYEPDYKGPPISELLQSGIQETIRFTKKNTDKDIYRFYESKNVFVDIPIPTKGFKFQAFAPDNFLSLRNLYKISEAFDTSFESNIKTHTSYEAFIDTYYTTMDNKFYINIITEENFGFIVSYLSEYYSHFCQNQLSLLPKISGLFHIKHKNFELYFIVKPYIFVYVPKNMYGYFYTKGIPEKGYLLYYKRTNNEMCHKEHDIEYTFKNGLIIPSDKHKNLQKVLNKDTEFLKSLDISDYIFMLGVSSSDKYYTYIEPGLVNLLSDVTNPDHNHTNTANVNLIIFIGIDHMFKKIKKTDHSYYTFHHHNCKFKHRVNEYTYDYGQHFVNFITKKLFKSN